MIGADKELRRARDRFGSHATQRALKETVEEVEGVTAFDSERIISQLGERLAEFKHHPRGPIGNTSARLGMVQWVTRQARLTSVVRRNLAQLRSAVLSVTGATVADADRVLQAVFDALPQYSRSENEIELMVWATPLAIELAGNALSRWTRYMGAQDAVLGGIWKILTGCRDLETAVGLIDIADNLELSVMAYFVANFDQFDAEEEILRRQLATRGFNAAREWKAKALEQLRKGERRKPSPGLTSEMAEIVQYNRAAGIKQAISRGYPIRLGPGDELPGEAVNLTALAPYDVPADYAESLAANDDMHELGNADGFDSEPEAEPNGESEYAAELPVAA